MEVGRDPLTEQIQALVAIAFFHVAQHLVVSTVLFDDVDGVLNGRSVVRRTREERLPVARDGMSEDLVMVGRVAGDRFAELPKLLVVNGREKRNRARLHMRN